MFNDLPNEPLRWRKYVVAIVLDAGTAAESTLDEKELLAASDTEAVEAAIEWARTPLASSGVSKAVIQVTKDGYGVRAIPVDVVK